jgi:hypothetical protein
MTFARRQLRLRILEVLARRAKTFRTRHDIWPMRVPREPVLLDEVLDEALGEDRAQFDERDLKTRSLLGMEWWAEHDEPASRWEAWIIALPSGLNLYCDSAGDESRILASCRRDAEGGKIDEFFLELLAGSAGEYFGIEMAGGAPSSVRTSMTDREFLIDFFVDLLEITKGEDSVRKALAIRDPGSRLAEDFRADVERWLSAVCP